jgi:hypothetical protein
MWPASFPGLLAFYHRYTNGGNPCVNYVKCHKNTAKSLVYPETNICSDRIWSRAESISDYTAIVKGLKRRFNATDISGGPPLITGDLFLVGWSLSINGTRRTLNIHIVTKDDARTLVYYKKNHKDLVRKSPRQSTTMHTTAFSEAPLTFPDPYAEFTDPYAEEEFRRSQISQIWLDVNNDVPF